MTWAEIICFTGSTWPCMSSPASLVYIGIISCSRLRLKNKSRYKKKKKKRITARQLKKNRMFHLSVCRKVLERYLNWMYFSNYLITIPCQNVFWQFLKKKKKNPQGFQSECILFWKQSSKIYSPEESSLGQVLLCSKFIFVTPRVQV